MKIYSNLKELVEAYQSGELTAKDKVIVDETAVILYVPDKDGDEVCIFDGENPYLLLTKALDLLGVPWKWA
jgi:hypothetical protein